MKKLIGIIIFLLASINICFSQQILAKNFLGIWMQTDKKNYIEIVQAQNKYIVIEYRAIEHELFFSGDGKSAVFVRFGKGPPGFDVVMLRMNGNRMERLYFSENNYDWELSQYSYYRKEN